MGTLRLQLNRDGESFERDIYIIGLDGRAKDIKFGGGELIYEAIKRTLDNGDFSYSQDVTIQPGCLLVTEPDLEKLDLSKMSALKPESIGLTTERVLVILKMIELGPGDKN